MLGLFLLIMLTSIVFGAASVSQAIHYFAPSLSSSLFSRPVLPQGEGTGLPKAAFTLFFILILLTAEWIQKNKNHEMQIENILATGAENRDLLHTHLIDPSIRFGGPF